MMIPSKSLYLITLLVSGLLPACVTAEDKTRIGDLPVFDAHIHYSHDIWEAISPDDAIRLLREVGIKRALVSSSSDEGTQRLYQSAPDFVVPSLRPYRKRGTTKTWMNDETLIPYLKQRLEKYRYAAIGEFHIEGMQTYTPVMTEVIKLARQYDLVLHVHGDIEAVEIIFEEYPQAHVLWAHSGFEEADDVKRLMHKHDDLLADLSFRHDIFQNGRFLPGWEALLTEHADRFLLGIDTYEPQRWLQLDNVMRWQRELLAALPVDTARKIAYDNSERITRRFDRK